MVLLQGGKNEGVKYLKEYLINTRSLKVHSSYRLGNTDSDFFVIIIDTEASLRIYSQVNSEPGKTLIIKIELKYRLPVTIHF
jgi:hypothetical protein